MITPYATSRLPKRCKHTYPMWIVRPTSASPNCNRGLFARAPPSCLIASTAGSNNSSNLVFTKQSIRSITHEETTQIASCLLSSSPRRECLCKQTKNNHSVPIKPTYDFQQYKPISISNNHYKTYFREQNVSSTS